MVDAGFEPGTSVSEVWCAANKPPHLHWATTSTPSHHILMIFYSVAEPKLIIFGSTFVHNFGSSSRSCHPVIYCHLKLNYNGGTIRNMSPLHPLTKLTLINIYCKNNFGSGSGSQITSAPPAPQHWFFLCGPKLVKIVCFLVNGLTVLWSRSRPEPDFFAGACEKAPAPDCCGLA